MVKGRVQEEARADRPSCTCRRHTGRFSVLGTGSGEEVRRLGGIAELV